MKMDMGKQAFFYQVKKIYKKHNYQIIGGIVEYDPWKDAEDWQLGEHMEADFLQNDVFKDRPIPNDLIAGVKRWSLQKFNKIMDGLFKAYGGDRDEQ